MNIMRLKWGMGILTIVFSVSAIFMVKSSKDAPIPEINISLNNMVEIKEEVQLDAYGFNRNDIEIQEGKVKRNESLYVILRDMDVSPQVIYELGKQSKGVFRSNNIRPGQRYIAYKKDDNVQRLILQTNALDYVVFDWEHSINVTTGRKNVSTQVTEASGFIESSLYETLYNQGQNTLLGNRLSEIFGWQIDFFRLYPGDTYKVIYEEEFVDGKPFGIGKILAAEFTNKGEVFDAYYFETENTAGYYDREGNGVQKALLKAPFKYSQRVSSNFSRNRFHPVLKRRMPHYGVDYAAPLGTPVLSVGDGEVIEAQRRGANGNIVKIRHNGTYTTAYLHLNGFAKGIKPGARVKQGQIIGFVGRTGRVTGVHLDYRIYKNGRPVNPLKVKLPPSKAIDKTHKSAFIAKVNAYQRELNAIAPHEETTIAAAAQ
jgi:murein DD-endopeptidase MepM/ murein hydrolase activator NlpD